MIVTTVECDDWIQMYCDDEQVYEGHSLPHIFAIPPLVKQAVERWDRFELLPEAQDEEAKEMDVYDYWFRNKLSDYPSGSLQIIESYS